MIAMEEIDIHQLRRVQLDLLIAFHQFCCENEIKYSLAAGTLIGAVRHKGFIPWDDDIDVYLLREDYVKLLKIFPAQQGHNVLVAKERDKKWHRAYAKLYDNRTLLIEKTKDQYAGLGVGIDIFPIDDVPDDQREWQVYNKKRILLRNLYTLKSLAFSNKRNLLKTMFILLCQILLFPFSFEKLADIIDRYSQKNNGKGYGHVYENCLGVYNSENAWQKKDFNNIYEIKFEGYDVHIMEGYDDYLRIVYGDYMQLPPEEKRHSHHGYRAYWKN